MADTPAQVALQAIDGEGPGKEPRDDWTSSDLDEAFEEGKVRGRWEMAAIARAVLPKPEQHTPETLLAALRSGRRMRPVSWTSAFLLRDGFCYVRNQHTFVEHTPATVGLETSPAIAGAKKAIRDYGPAWVEVTVQPVAAQQGRAQGAAVENDPHRFAVVSSDYCRPFLLGAYPKLENAVKAQCGSPEKWDIFERYIATPQAGRRVMAEKPKITFERQYGGGYVVFADEDRLGFVRELSRGEWVSTDSYLNAVRGTRPTRKKAVEVLLRRHRKQGEA